VDIVAPREYEAEDKGTVLYRIARSPARVILGQPHVAQLRARKDRKERATTFQLAVAHFTLQELDSPLAEYSFDARPVLLLVVVEVFRTQPGDVC